MLCKGEDKGYALSMTCNCTVFLAAPISPALMSLSSCCSRSFCLCCSLLLCMTALWNKYCTSSSLGQSWSTMGKSMCRPQVLIKLACTCMKCMCICSENIDDIILPIRLEFLARAQGLVRELQPPLKWPRWPLISRSAVELNLEYILRAGEIIDGKRIRRGHYHHIILQPNNPFCSTSFCSSIAFMY